MVSGKRNNIFLSQGLDGIGDRLKIAGRANPVRTVAVLHSAQALSLEDGGHREEEGEGDDHGNDGQYRGGERLRTGRDEAQQPMLGDNEDLIELNQCLSHFDSPPTGCASGAGAAVAGAAGLAATAAFALASAALARSAASAPSTAAASVG